MQCPTARYFNYVNICLFHSKVYIFLNDLIAINFITARHFKSAGDVEFYSLETRLRMRRFFVKYDTGTLPDPMKAHRNFFS
jgi:hypothetical protein